MEHDAAHAVDEVVVAEEEGDRLEVRRQGVGQGKKAKCFVFW